MQPASPNTEEFLTSEAAYLQQGNDSRTQEPDLHDADGNLSTSSVSGWMLLRFISQRSATLFDLITAVLIVFSSYIH